MEQHAWTAVAEIVCPLAWSRLQTRLTMNIIGADSLYSLKPTQAPPPHNFKWASHDWRRAACINLPSSELGVSQRLVSSWPPIPVTGHDPTSRLLHTHVSNAVCRRLKHYRPQKPSGN